MSAWRSTKSRFMETKTCSKCGQELPATIEYFYKDKHCRYGVSSICKQCQGHPYGVFRDCATDGFKMCTVCKERIPKTTEYFHSGGRNALKSACKKCTAQAAKEKCQKNGEARRERNRAYYAKKYLENGAYWEKMKVRAEQWRLAHKGTAKFKANNIKRAHVRKARQAQLPATMTRAAWESCKKYFNRSCAYCGKPLERLTQDHFIPLARGGEYTAENIIPACGSCNSSKNSSDPFCWYPRQPFYDTKRWTKITKYLGYKENTQQLSFL